MGLRALMRLLLTYHIKYGLDTVESIINRYAPPHENQTHLYMRHVARRLQVEFREVVDLRRADVLIGMARAIVRHENGRPPEDTPADWYALDMYEEAARLALLP